MPMYRGEWAQLMVPGLHDIFVQFTDLHQRDVEYTAFLNVEQSDSAFEDEFEVAGLPPAQTKEEGEPITYEDLIPGGIRRYTNETVALGIRTSLELFEDDKYNLIKMAPKALARSIHFVKEQRSANVLNNGFTTQLSSDGVSLFNTAHPLLGGAAATNVGPGLSNIISSAGTFPNRPTVDTDLSISALQLAYNQFERLVDGRGIPVILKPEKLLIPPELEFIAIEILGSPKKPYTPNNEVNAILVKDLTYKKLHYLTSTSAWFLLCGMDSHQMKFKQRRALDEDFADDFDTRAIKQIAFERFGVGATTWMGVWGTSGP